MSAGNFRDIYRPISPPTLLANFAISTYYGHTPAATYNIWYRSAQVQTNRDALSQRWPTTSK